MRRPKAINLRFQSQSELPKIRRAAAIAKQSINSFILMAAERRADAVIAEYETAQATIRESQAVNQ